MKREEKIVRIYEVIANKELSFWCIVKVKWKYGIWMWFDQSSYGRIYDCKRNNWDLLSTLTSDEDTDDIEIIWHPVMIGDVLDWMSNHPFIRYKTELFLSWEHKRKQIDDQADSCVDFIYSLVIDEKE